LLSRVAVFRDLRVAIVILGVVDEKQAYRLPLLQQKNKVLTALVKTRVVRK
jgi:hypothetical protein